MKCLLKTIISLVVIVAIAAVLLYFWGIPTLLAEDKAADHLEKKGYDVSVASEAECDAMSLRTDYEIEGYIFAEKDSDMVSIWYLKDSSDAKQCKKEQEAAVQEVYDAMADAVETISPNKAESLREEAKEIKTVRFGKIVIQGNVRGIVAAIAGL